LITILHIHRAPQKPQGAGDYQVLLHHFYANIKSTLAKIPTTNLAFYTDFL